MKTVVNTMTLCEVSNQSVKAKVSSKKIKANLAGTIVGDAVESTNPAEMTEASLDAEFAAIKKRAKEAMTLRIKSRKQFYVGLVELLMFWKRASKQRNYLDKFYGAADSKHKRTVNHGHNFAPLIADAWSGVVDMDTNKKNRWSRAMNNLNTICEKEVKYQTDTVNGLVMLLVEKGLDAFVKYGQSNKQTGDEVGDIVTDGKFFKKKNKAISFTDIKKLHPIGTKHFQSANLVPNAKFDKEIKVNNDELSLVLLRNMGNDKYAVISSTADSTPMKKFVAYEYAADYTATPNALRVLYETMSTQCPPHQFQRICHKLIEKVGVFADGTVKNSVRRLFYKHDTGQFIMSSIRVDSSVVTIVNPKVTMLKNPCCDVLLSTMSRRKLEEELISPRKFNLFVANDLHESGAICDDGNNFHSTTLSNPNGDEHIDVIFGPELSKKESFYQVTIKKWAEKKADWSVELPMEWIKTFEKQFTSKWLASHGKHAVRSHQKMLELEFGSKSLVVKFFEKDNEFDLKNEVFLSVDSVKGNPQTLRVLSKDFAIAMHALDSMTLVGNVRVFLIHNFIALKYETEVGSYELYIPACDEKGVRKSTGFTKYQLGVYEPDTFDCAAEQSEEEAAEVL